jgi:hypothetical protein
VTWEDGSTATTHDKGFSSCVVSIGDTQIEVTTLHLIPFRMFKIELESETARGILHEIEAHRVGRAHRPLSRHSHVRGRVATAVTSGLPGA